MLPFIQSLRCAIPFYILRKMPWWIKAFLLNSCYHIFFFYSWWGLILLYRLVIKEQVLIMNCDKREVKNFDRQIWYNDTEDNIYSTLSSYLDLLYMFNCRKTRGKSFLLKEKTLDSLLTESLLESLLQRSGEYVTIDSLSLLVGKW